MNGTPHKNFKVYTRDGWKTIKGIPFSLIAYPGYDFFVHHDLDHYAFMVVSEKITGMKVSHEEMLQINAVNNADWTIHKHGGKERLESSVQAAKDEGRANLE